MGALVVDSETAPGSISVAVVTAVADILGRDPNTIEPLYNAIDPEALDALFVPTRTNSRPVGGQVTFSLEGCDVAVYANGRVEVVTHEDSEP